MMNYVYIYIYIYIHIALNLYIHIKFNYKDDIFRILYDLIFKKTLHLVNIF